MPKVSEMITSKYLKKDDVGDGVTYTIRALPRRRSRHGGYGLLKPDPAGLLDLPEGFQYRAFSTALQGSENDPRFTQRMSNGELVPARHDGMAAFAGLAGITVLVRNHELEPDHRPVVDPSGRRRYDRLGTGGTTTLWVDGDRNLVRSFPSLAATFRNCAGGATPCGVAIALDRMERGSGPLSAVQEGGQSFQLPVVSTASLDDRVTYLEQQGTRARQLQQLARYCTQYGAAGHVSSRRSNARFKDRRANDDLC